MGRWVVEEFDRESGQLRGRHVLENLSDDEARALLGLTDLGNGDLYDVPEDSLVELSRRFDLAVSTEEVEYLLGREADSS